MTIVGIFVSCKFNITDNPGPQLSTSIESAKMHSTFICAYKIKGNMINNIPLESIFAEKKYSLGQGFFKGFETDCCETQLVIVFKENNKTASLNDVPTTWDIIGFSQPNSRIMVKYIKGIFLPDTVHIMVRPDVKKKYI